MKKKALTWLVCVAMLMSLLPTTVLAVDTATTVDLSAKDQTITAAGEYSVTGYDGVNTLTVAVNGDTTITLSDVNIAAGEGTSAISIESGNVTLIADGDNTLTGGDNGAGIYVAEGASVTIKGNGKLTATGNAGEDDDSGAAGVGGTWANGNSGAITIDGATVIAKGYGVHGSGIGSGSGKVVGEIKIINGANVTAQGGYYADGAGTKLQSSYGKSDPEGGAAIGGGGKTASTIANITITDSAVIAYGGSKAAGIGANFWSNCGKIMITNSTVTAQGGSSSAGIGTSRAGDAGVSGNIVISGGKVVATGGDYGAGIGGGYNADSVTDLPAISIAISGAANVTATGGMGGAGIGGGYKTNNLDISISDSANVNANAGKLVDGKTVETGGSACAIGSGANGSGTFEGSKVVIADTATVTATAYEDNGGKPKIELSVAKVGETFYNDLKDAFADATSGETVELLTNITYTESDIVYAHGGGTGFGKYDAYNPSIIYFGGTAGATAAGNQPSKVNAVLDLNGYTITNNAEAYLFLPMDNSKLTIKDSSEAKSGGITVTTGYPAVWAVGTDTLVTIEGGKFTTANDEGLLWSTHGGDLIVEGGAFSTTADDASLLIVRNERDLNNPNYFVDGNATITVTGGTFYGFNPENTPDDSTNPYTDFNSVAEDYVAVEDPDDVWTVDKDYVIWVKEQLLKGENVTLDRDIVVDGSYIESIPAATNGNGEYFNPGIFNVVGDIEVTFDLNGHSITYNGHEDVEYTATKHKPESGYVNSCSIAHGLFFANNGGNLTIVDNSSDKSGEVMVYGLASGVYSASPSAVITVEGGTWKNEGCKTCGGTNLFLYVSHGGELYIKDGYFEQALDSEGKSYLIVEHGGEYANSVIDYSLSKIEISGGTFVGMDPENAVFIDQGDGQAMSETNVVAEGYVSVAAGDSTWTVEKPVSVTITTSPTNAVVVLADANGNTVTANGDGTYTLYDGEEYSYTVSASGYDSKTGSFTAVDGKAVTVSLNREYVPSYDYDVPSYPVKNTVEGVKASHRTAEAGETVTLTVKEGYDISDIVVTDKRGNEVKLTYKNGKYTFKMPAGKVTVTAVVDSDVFTDVNVGDWFYDAVKYAYDNDIMAGMGDNKFGPNAELTRAMVAQVLYNLDENRYTASGKEFADVIAGEWYVDAVNWAVAEDIFAGYGNGYFGTLDSVTREQLAMILYNYAVSKGYTISGNAVLGMYADADMTSGWAVGAMEWAVANGIIFSTEGLLTPNAPASRAEVAYAMMMFCENIMG